jgi:phage baseplate assembly protein W
MVYQPPVVAKELMFPLHIDSSGEFGSTTNPAAMVEQHILSAVGTTVSERVMRGDYGTSINTHIFGSNDSAAIADIRGQILHTISQFVPEAQGVGVDIQPDMINGTITVKILYSLNNSMVQTVTTTIGA